MSEREFNLVTAMAIMLALFFGVVMAYVLPAVLEPVHDLGTVLGEAVPTTEAVQP
jgi:hypothetical protein